MQNKAIQILKCPYCITELILTILHTNNEEIIDGYLWCHCERWYPIIKGVPRMLPDNLRSKLSQTYPDFFMQYKYNLPKSSDFDNEIYDDNKEQTRKSFAYEWKYFNTFYSEYEQQFLDWIEPVKPDFFKNKLVLDAGCGMGRHLRIAKQYGANVIGIDLSEAVDVAYENVQEMGILIVQADIYQLPFSSHAFDYVYSIGVLHHLPNPETGFHKLVQQVKTGGHISIWVYGRENNFSLIMANPLRKYFFSRIPLSFTYYIALLMSMAIFPIAHLYVLLQKIKLPPFIIQFLPQYHFLNYLSRFSFSIIHNIVFDQLIAPTAFYLTKQEVEQWFTHHKIKQAILSHRNCNSWRAFIRV